MRFATRRGVAHAAAAAFRPHGAASPGRAAHGDHGRELVRAGCGSRSGIDGTVANTGVERYRDMAGRHLTTIERRAAPTRTPCCWSPGRPSRTSGSPWRPAPRCTPGRRHRRSGAGRRSRTRSRHEFDPTCAPASRVAVEKIVALVTSRDRAVSEPAAAAVELLAEAPAFDELLSDARAGLAQLWRRFRVDLTDGRRRHGGRDAAHAAAVACSTCCRPSRRTTSTSTRASRRAGCTARLTAGTCSGTSCSCFPVLTLRLPGLARALLRYRTRRLDAARRAARAAGYAGAMYPWQSGSDGREESQRVHLNPLSGRWLPDTSHLQRHVGLAVAYNIWQYYQATGDLRVPRRPRRRDAAGDRPLLRRPGDLRPRRGTVSASAG